MAVKPVREFKRGKLIFYLSNNVAKKCPCELKISRDIKIKYLFRLKVYFHVLDIFHTSCQGAFKGNRQEVRIGLLYYTLFYKQ